MALVYEKLVHGNYSCARVAKATIASGSKTITGLGTAISFSALTNVTPNAGAPAEISYTDVKTANGTTIRAEQNNNFVKASNGEATFGGTEASLQIVVMTTPANREVLIASAGLGEVYACMAPAGKLANGSGTAGWYHILGKLTEATPGDANDESIQELTLTFTGVLGYTADIAFTFAEYKTAMTTTALTEFGIDGSITPTAIIAGDFVKIIGGSLVAVGTPVN